MKQFISVNDVPDVAAFVQEAIELKKQPYAFNNLGKHKTLGLIFMNPSLRTRLSIQKAATNLGMQVMAMNIDKDGWTLELQEDSVMNGTTVEHIKDAAAVMGLYCDIIGIRSFPSLKNREDDYNEVLLHKFIKYCGVPVVSLESATLHPLQSFADTITLKENWHQARKPKVVLTWAPHIKPLPQAVANSFAQWMGKTDVDFVMTHPEGFELNEQFTANANITHNQAEALEEADFVYVKNWSGYNDYGKTIIGAEHWMLTEKHLQHSRQAKIMHCLPVRRNVELSDELIDGPNSLVLQQAHNRLFATQTILKQMLTSL
jgi:N-succinyl-L-ornithine transcarbamylase